MQVTVCAVDPSSDQLTSIQLPADASLTDAAEMLGNALTEDDSAVNQYWVNLDPESQDDIIPRLPHGDPIFEINLVLLSARPGGKRCQSSSCFFLHLGVVAPAVLQMVLLSCTSHLFTNLIRQGSEGLILMFSHL